MRFAPTIVLWQGLPNLINLATQFLNRTGAVQNDICSRPTSLIAQLGSHARLRVLTLHTARLHQPLNADRGGSINYEQQVEIILLPRLHQERNIVHDHSLRIITRREISLSRPLEIG